MKGLFLALTLCLVFLPSLATAQGDVSIYNPDPEYGLVPCGSSGQEPCTTNHVVAFANNLITWLISILGIIAVIALIITGFKLVVSAGNPSAWAEAKSMFTNIVIGIVIILAAWLVVDTILKGLTDEGLNERSDDLQVEEPVEPVERGQQYYFEEQGGRNETGSGTLEECQARVQQLLSEGRRVTQCTPVPGS